jgi:hypothetical protein
VCDQICHGQTWLSLSHLLGPMYVSRRASHFLWGEWKTHSWEFSHLFWNFCIPMVAQCSLLMDSYLLGPPAPRLSALQLLIRGPSYQPSLWLTILDIFLWFHLPLSLLQAWPHTLCSVYPPPHTSPIKYRVAGTVTRRGIAVPTQLCWVLRDLSMCSSQESITAQMEWYLGFGLFLPNVCCSPELLELVHS